MTYPLDKVIRSLREQLGPGHYLHNVKWASVITWVIVFSLSRFEFGSVTPPTSGGGDTKKPCLVYLLANRNSIAQIITRKKVCGD